MIRIKSQVTFICNKITNKKIDSILTKIDKNDTCNIFKALYQHPEIKKDWIRKNTGCEWIDFNYNQNKLLLTTRDFLPIKFFSHLWNVTSKLDPNIIIEVKFQSESNDPVGAFVFKDGVYSVNDDEFDPDEENNEMIEKRINELVNKCYDEINKKDYFIIKYKED